MSAPAKPLIEQYLSRYAEIEASALAACDNPWPSQCQFSHALIIPAYKEAADFFARLARRHMNRESILLIVIINQPDMLAAPHPDNQRLSEQLQSATEPVWRQDNLRLGKLPGTDSAVLSVDRFSTHPIPRRQGVGLARKIGADLALALHHRAIVKNPWLYTSDADALLPEKYFRALQDHDACAAAIYPYQHIRANSKLSRATELYEQRLTQYVDGLSSADSPYAYHTLGSTIVIRAEAYAKVRGFPKRNGGEDFHLLNKLAKVGDITSLEAPLIRIQARDSDRVPFGTGPAVSQLLKEADPRQARIFYHPQVFSELKSWLDALPSSQVTDLIKLPLGQPSIAALQKLGTQGAIARARQTSKHRDTYARHMHNWFDALKTLRFIHFLQEQGLTNLSFAEMRQHSLATRTGDSTSAQGHLLDYGAH